MTLPSEGYTGEQSQASRWPSRLSLAPDSVTLAQLISSHFSRLIRGLINVLEADELWPAHDPSGVQFPLQSRGTNRHEKDHEKKSLS